MEWRIGCNAGKVINYVYVSSFVVLCVTIATHTLHSIFCMLFIFISQAKACCESTCVLQVDMLHPRTGDIVGNSAVTILE